MQAFTLRKIISTNVVRRVHSPAIISFPSHYQRLYSSNNNLHNNKTPSPKLTPQQQQESSSNNNSKQTLSTATTTTTTENKQKKKLTKSSKEWLRRQLKDTYVKARNGSSTEQSKGIKYRSRAGFKLQQLDEKLKFVSHAHVVMDLGAAPGAWSQYVAKFMRKGGVLVSVDLLPMEQFVKKEDLGQLRRHVTIQGDFTMEETLDRIHASLNEVDDQQQGSTTRTTHIQADTILSDMAQNTTGNQSLDHGRIMQLCHSVVDFVEKGALKPGGTLLMKFFAGPEEMELRNRLKALFTAVTSVKPDASRQDSSEMYLYARNYLPRKSVPEDSNEDQLDPRVAVKKQAKKNNKKITPSLK